MHLPHIHLLLALLSSLISTATATAMPHIPPHDLPTITSSRPAPPLPPPTPLLRRGGGFSPHRIAGLPPGWSGIFTHFRTTRPTIPIQTVFIRFFRVAASLAANDPYIGRHFQRFEYGAPVMEMFATEEGAYVSKEFMQAASLWLMDAAVNGWTGLFEAWVMDREDGEMVYLRLATIWDLPKKVSNSPWGDR